MRFDDMHTLLEEALLPQNEMMHYIPGAEAPEYDEELLMLELDQHYDSEFRQESFESPAQQSYYAERQSTFFIAS